MKKIENIYEPPRVLHHAQIKFETAQSWNPGKGNLIHNGVGQKGNPVGQNSNNPIGGGTSGPPGQLKKNK